MSPDLIFDVGMNEGQDSSFYLAKGFRVVAIDANPHLCGKVSIDRFEEISSGRLRVLNVGIAAEALELDFYVNHTSDDWSSFDPLYGQRGGHFETIKVRCRTLLEIIEECGEIPYYLKIDIEGHDQACLDALPKLEARPKFVSTEAGVVNFAEQLAPLGYGRFKIISQVWNPFLPHCKPAREGRFVDQPFTGRHSGPFGDETYGPWLTNAEFNEEHSRILNKTFSGSLHERLECPQEIFNNSWWDFHAALGD
jgi:FkbM family methyltransferase